MKKIIIAFLAGAVVVGGLVGWFAWRGREHSAPPPVSPSNIPPGFTKPKVIETTPAIKKLIPGTKPNAADTALAGWPEGTTIIHYSPPEGPPVDIAITPDGQVFAPQGVAGDIVVYKKPIPAIRFAPRPFVGAGYGTGGIAGAIGADIVEIKRARIGIAAIVDRGSAARRDPAAPESIEIAGGIAAGADLIGPIGIRGIAAMTPAGEFRAAAIATIGIR